MADFDDRTATASPLSASGVNSTFNTSTLASTHDLQSPPSRIVYLVVGPHEYSMAAKCIFAFTCVIVVGGLVGNVLSINTFLKMGLKDCVTITFFNLAVSDFCCLLVFCMFGVANMNNLHLIDNHYSDEKDKYTYFNTILGLDPGTFIIFADKIYDVVFFVSSSLICFLAVQRSLCVLFPLRFKGMFTPTKTVIILTLIWSYWVIVSIIGWSFASFKTVDHGYRANATRIKMKPWDPSIFFKNFSLYRKWANRILLPALFLVTVFGGVFVMAFTLIKSMRFRETATSLGKVPQENSTTTSASGKSGNDQENVNQPVPKRIGSSKERLAIVQVAILSAFFLLSQFPAIIWILVRTVRPELDSDRAYRYFGSLLPKTFVAMDTANASVNFLVYYKFNSRFREVCFRRKGRSEATVK